MEDNGIFPTPDVSDIVAVLSSLFETISVSPPPSPRESDTRI